MKLWAEHGRLASNGQRIWFLFRTVCFQLRRHLRDCLSPPARRPALGLPRRSPARADPVRVEIISPLGFPQSGAELPLHQGKIVNLRIASAALNGRSFAAGEIFSFWRCLGRPTAARGYAIGRELREGCMIASVGGGLCQLSNSLFQAARQAGCEILERHAHTRVVPGSAAQLGHDATVFWNYVDLRFRALVPFSINVEVTEMALMVQFVGLAKDAAEPALVGERSVAIAPAHDCLTCPEHDCVYQIKSDPANPGGSQKLTHANPTPCDSARPAH